jgi:hypothetical protein
MGAMRASSESTRNVEWGRRRREADNQDGPRRDGGQCRFRMRSISQRCHQQQIACEIHLLLALLAMSADKVKVRAVQAEEGQMR